MLLTGSFSCGSNKLVSMHLTLTHPLCGVMWYDFGCKVCTWKSSSASSGVLALSSCSELQSACFKALTSTWMSSSYLSCMHVCLWLSQAYDILNNL